MTKSQFEKLYVDNYGLLYYFLWGRIRNKHQAEDLVCETFAVAFERLEQLRDPAKAKAWLWSIGINLLKRDWEIAGRRRLQPLDLTVDPQDPYDFVEELSRFMECQRAAALAQTMPRHLRKAMAHYVSGLTIRQAAKLEGVPTGTAGRRLYEAKNLLRERCAA